MSERTGIEILAEVLERAKWSRSASNKLVRVRHVDEMDEETLERVIEDYAAVRRILLQFVNKFPNQFPHGGTQLTMLDRAYKGYIPLVLKSILEQVTLPAPAAPKEAS